jgi:hypothetical protein
MGEVFLARDTRFGREVAIKIFPAFFSGDQLAPCAIRIGSASGCRAANNPNIAGFFRCRLPGRRLLSRQRTDIG